jgi:hypothetical protein
MSDGSVYLLGVVEKYQVDANTKFHVKNAFDPIIKEWGGGVLLDFTLSGSSAKGTEVSNSSDVDFFISLSSNTTGTLQEIFDSLFNKLNGYSNVSARKQNVSIGVAWDGYNIDFTPGRKRSGNTNDHTLCKNKSNSWTLTNVQRHINIVTGANRTNEIKLTKIWRENHQLYWPSIFLELFVIDALKGFRQDNIEGNFTQVLNEIENKIETKYILDPSNTNNMISDDIGSMEKKSIKLQARSSSQSRTWGNVVW